MSDRGPCNCDQAIDLTHAIMQALHVLENPSFYRNASAEAQRGLAKRIERWAWCHDCDNHASDCECEP